MDYKSVRHVVLTVDLKKFDGSGQKAYETLRERKAVAQFIHDLKPIAVFNNYTEKQSGGK